MCIGVTPILKKRFLTWQHNKQEIKIKTKLSSLSGIFGVLYVITITAILEVIVLTREVVVSSSFVAGYRKNLSNYWVQNRVICFRDGPAVARNPD